MKRLLIGFFLLSSASSYALNCYEVHSNLDLAVKCALANREDIAEARKAFKKANYDMSKLDQGVTHRFLCKSITYVGRKDGSNGLPHGDINVQDYLKNEAEHYIGAHEITLEKVANNLIKVGGDTIFKDLYNYKNNQLSKMYEPNQHVAYRAIDKNTVIFESSVRKDSRDGISHIPKQIQATSSGLLDKDQFGVMEYGVCTAI